MRVPIKVNELLRSVVVGPEAPPWFVDLVQDVASKYLVTVPVRRSKLAFDPVGELRFARRQTNGPHREEGAVSIAAGIFIGGYHYTPPCGEGLGVGVVRRLALAIELRAFAPLPRGSRTTSAARRDRRSCP